MFHISYDLAHEDTQRASFAEDPLWFYALDNAVNLYTRSATASFSGVTCVRPTASPLNGFHKIALYRIVNSAIPVPGRTLPALIL